MSELEARYFDDYAYLERRGDESLDGASLAVIDRMSSHERLWYRVGALMAARVERELGSGALVDLITQPRSRLVETYRALRRRRR